MTRSGKLPRGGSNGGSLLFRKGHRDNSFLNPSILY